MSNRQARPAWDRGRALGVAVLLGLLFWTASAWSPLSDSAGQTPQPSAPDGVLGIQAGSTSPLAILRSDPGVPVARQAGPLLPYSMVLAVAGVLFVLARPPRRAAPGTGFVRRHHSFDTDLLRWGRAPPAH